MKTPLTEGDPFGGFSLAAGTYGVTRISGVLGVCVRLGEYLVDGNADWSHAFVLIECLEDGDWTIVEAEPGGARVGLLSEYADQPVAFNDQQFLTDSQRREIVQEALNMVGYGYGWLDYASIALDRFGLRWARLQKRVERGDRLICSQLVDVVYCLAGVHLFADHRTPGSVTPGDLSDVITRHLWTRPGGMYRRKDTPA